MLEALIIATLTRAAAQAFDVYRPAAPGPTVLFVHGGAWVSGARAEYADLGRGLARAGVCAVIIDYHLAPEFKHPRPVEDVERARADFAARPGERCDARQIVLMGHSAGAHAIASWATRFASGVRGFIGLEGIYDLPRLAAKWPAYPDQFLSAAFGPTAGWASASPARAKLMSKAPWLVVHSRADELVDVGQSDAFAAHARAAGAVVARETPARETHFGVVTALSNDGPLRARVLRFVRESTR